MATIIRVSGADFSANSVGFLAPVTAGLLGWFYLGGTQAETQQDRAGVADGVLVGSPTLHDGYVSFGGVVSGQYLNTSMMETAAMTMLVVARSTEAAHSGTDLPMFMSNFGNSGVGCSLYISAGIVPAGQIRLGGGQNNNGVNQAQINTTLSNEAATSWGFYAGKFESTSNDITQQLNARKLISKTSNQTNSTNNYPRVVGTNPLRIGAGYNSGFTGSCDVAFAAAYSSALSDAQIDLIYDSVKARLAGKHGIVI